MKKRAMTTLVNILTNALISAGRPELVQPIARRLGVRVAVVKR